MNDPQLAHGGSEVSPEDASAAPGLETYFQPFYNLRSGELQGLEALIRRHNTEKGHTELPGDFFADAEATGAMRDIDLRMLDEALTHMERWHGEEGRSGLILSVNVSRATITQPTFADDVLNTLDRHRVPGDRLLLDITTSTFRDLTAEGGALNSLRQLQEREITFCLDGFSPDDLDLLEAAAATPVDIIKLRPSLLNSGSDGQLAEVTKAIQNAGLPVVAAGIETAEQLELVRSLDIEWAQGFHLGEPTDADSALRYPQTLPES